MNNQARSVIGECPTDVSSRLLLNTFEGGARDGQEQARSRHIASDGSHGDILAGDIELGRAVGCGQETAF